MFFSNKKVMFDKDLAQLYGVETKRLNEAVKRNIKRFPTNFMFQLTHEEFENLKSQFATSSWGGVRKLPYAFTEHGVTMLASVLNSDRAIEISIKIVETFIALRQLALENQEISSTWDSKYNINSDSYNGINNYKDSIIRDRLIAESEEAVLNVRAAST